MHLPEERTHIGVLRHVRKHVSQADGEPEGGLLVEHLSGEDRIPEYEASLSLRYLVSVVPTKDWPAHSLRAQGCSLAFCKA